MSTNTVTNQNLAHVEHGHHDAGGTKVFGFWLYIMSDLILFACLFATYVVLADGTAGGPEGKDIFSLKFVLGETFLLLVSSITYGFAMIAMHKGKIAYVNVWLFATFLLGLGFVIMEVYEFHELIAEGFGPDRSGFLSGFFALVATHGLHVSAGLVWIIIMMIQISRRGLTEVNKTRLNCLSLFWHFLDVVWICVFTVVYLLGAI
ncbi:Cytochrome o ubiquinol oxidase subunit 3 [Providencia rustigianii]|uniref:Cytochrome bo(3) ubiquinol oxidase subunit 3 n=1 Tax=Providencia rustigianii TaxID=158850 RepID=A0A379G0N4_9GAMM|nr:cytochrome o ubiquinol oxidase subunit III [Providencia rustigianii]SUC34579.1 Cytochrome o ubiquinol oxidase subunit 3 [Providencia rustigianii]